MTLNSIRIELQLYYFLQTKANQEPTQKERSMTIASEVVAVVVFSM